ncbi:homoserine O-acetyltransferase [Malassezia equina]|uniref:Homoserine O-acetyltransferase n=1 Tax=Malassezia equina TaxID=1381935 RepID=A0AAF0EDZ7_9BASI|nr:homoserine O-acetyltransferase [Malassezia equina]
MAAPIEIPGPTSPLAVGLSQRYLLLPTFELESGTVLHRVPVAFQTWGELNATRTNALLVCHPISGNANVAEWWEPLFGEGRVLDPKRYFIVCCNAIGSPYGTLSPLTRKGGELWDEGRWVCAPHVHAPHEQDTETWWGPDLPPTTIRDDVRLQKHVLDYLGVQQLASVMGGSMGGATALEWPLCFPVRTPLTSDALVHASSDDTPYVRSIVVLAASPRHSAWCIAWCEIQRQAIEADTRFRDGHYLLRDPPSAGLAAARMCALMTYRQPQSLERRFSRLRGKSNLAPQGPSQASSLMEEGGDDITPSPSITQPQAREQYAVQSYLHHHGAKFLTRFDALCYLHLSDKLDAHDVSRDRAAWAGNVDNDTDVLSGVLSHLGTSPVKPHVLVLSVTSDMLYTPEEQMWIHKSIPGSHLVHIESTEGHDGFLIEYPQIQRAIYAFLSQYGASNVAAL